jgi:N-acetylglucosamine-6-phosphate deacetylase
MRSHLRFKSITGRDPWSGKPFQITIEDGLIQAIAPGSPDERAWLSPGLIDLQVNGYLGSDLNSGADDPEVVIALTREMVRTGVTTYLPTIITSSEQKITTSLRAVAEARRANPLVAHAVPFVHVEGPFISPEDGPRGAHPREHVRPPSLAEFERWQAASNNLVGMVTLSPHWEGALKFISTLTSKGILMAIGHSDASSARIHAAVDAGATLSTHLGNGLGSPLPRHPNLLWAQLAEDRLTACFIADGHHLPVDTLKVMLRAKGIDRSVLVSDVIALGGMPAGIYEIGDDPPSEVTPDERVVNAYGPRFLMGAYRPLMDGIANVASMDGFSLGDAIRMATWNPGRFVGRRGELRVGADADLVRFHWEPSALRVQIESVLIQGKKCQ